MGCAGTLLGERYRLGQRIGAGGFSEVRRAWDSVLERQVAIKLLDARYARDDEAVERFHGEARNAGCLAHPNVARVYDLGEAGPDSPPYLVMELVDGPSLAEVLRSGPVGPQRCLEIVAQAAAGLHAAHSAGLVHRDIKPGNLLIGQDGTVKVADFGIAHAIGSVPLTCTGIVVGSPGFVAPERASGQRATPSSDLYALGVVAYECLAGGPPFTGTGLEVALAHLSLPFPPLPQHVPGEVAALVARLTDKDPDRRPADAGEVVRQARALQARLAAGAADGIGAPGLGAPVLEAPVLVARSGGVLAEGAGGGIAVFLAGGSQGTRTGAIRHARQWRPVRALAGRLRRVVASAQPGWRASLAGVAVVGALASVAIVGGAASSGDRAAHLQAGLRPARSASMTPGVRAVDLIGLPVRDAARRLRRQGLRVLIRWQPSRAQRPGRVVSVGPRGLRPAGSTVTLVGAISARHPAGGVDAASGGTATDLAGAAGGQAVGRGAGRGHGAARLGHGRQNGQGAGTGED